MCNKCYSSVQDVLDADERTDLDESEVPDDELDFDGEFHEFDPDDD